MVIGVQSGLFESHLLPGRVHLVGQQHGEAGVYALTHFGLRHDYRHGIVRRYFDPAIEGHLARRDRQRLTGNKGADAAARSTIRLPAHGRTDGALDEMTTFELCH